MSNKLIDFELYNKKENYIYIDSLEDDSISIDLCSLILQNKFDKKNENPILVIQLDKILNESSCLQQIYYNIINQTTNLDIIVDFDLTNIKTEYLKLLLEQWFKDTRSVKYTISIINLLEECILFSLNKDYNYLTSKDILEDLIYTFKLELNNIIQFLNSIPLFLTTSLDGFIEHHLNEDSQDLSLDEKSNLILDILNKNSVAIINDINAIQKNVICLFYNPLFLTSFYSNIELNNTYYFQQFTQYIYNGKNLYYYFANENNILYKAIESLTNEEVKTQFVDVFKFFNKSI